MVAGIKLETFYDAYESAMANGDAAIFAGAGLSRSVGYVDWHELLSDIATDLGLDIKREHDLIALAQYHKNERATRSRLNQKLVEEFTKHAAATDNHDLIARLPVRTIWTTNYDTLIEDAFKTAKKRVDVKIVSENLATTIPHADVTIFKMHGDISLPHEAVITKEDYETYNEKRQLFSTRLQGDLVSKTFLFVGFSFTDPNIDYLLSRIRVLLGQNTREHYCILKRLIPRKGLRGKAKADFEYQAKAQEYRINDLKRYSIRAVLIDEYSEVSNVLRELNRRSHLNDVFVSGSAATFDPLGKDKLEGLSRLIGQELMRIGCNLISGFGVGIGGAVLVGSMEVAYEKALSINERITMRPFPQGTPPNGMTQQEFWDQYRRDMLKQTGFAIFLSGNKFDASRNATVIADGVLKEFAIAKEMKVHPIPVGVTGHAAKQIWEEVFANLDSFFPGRGVKTNFQVLNDPTKSNEEIVTAIAGIIKRVKRTPGA